MLKVNVPSSRLTSVRGRTQLRRMASRQVIHQDNIHQWTQIINKRGSVL